MLWLDLSLYLDSFFFMFLLSLEFFVSKYICLSRVQDSVCGVSDARIQTVLF